jgi:pimeloyl-ACP methyl ester carboxylesterase
MKRNSSETFAGAPTLFVKSVSGSRYAFRRFGVEARPPLLFLQHFMGTMDNWDPAITDPLSESRPILLFDNAGVGRAEGKTPATVAAMAGHVLSFSDALGLRTVDILGFSLGGMVAREVALQRPSLVRRLVLVGTGPEGGQNMSMLKPQLLAILQDPTSDWNDRVRKLFFAPTTTSQAAARAFQERQATRMADKEPMSGPEVFSSQAAAIVAWETDFQGERFARLATIESPTLVFNGSKDIMIPTQNSFLLSDNLPDAQLAIYPDSGHGALFQYHAQFTRLVHEFLDR